jgi:acyl-CoA reductase-like NAD-dependent aldehyde dehydrogenase
MKRCMLETPRRDACVVLPDADLDSAVGTIAESAFGSSPSRGV